MLMLVQSAAALATMSPVLLLRVLKRKRERRWFEKSRYWNLRTEVCVLYWREILYAIFPQCQWRWRMGKMMMSIRRPRRFLILLNIATVAVFQVGSDNPAAAGDLDQGEALSLDAAGSSFLSASRQKLQIHIHEPHDGEVIWTEDIGASFDVVVEIHGGGFNYWYRTARIDADAVVELDGQEIWHSDGSLSSAELTIWNSRVTIEVGDDGSIVNRIARPHSIVARLVDGSEELYRVSNSFEVARSTGGQGWAKDSPYSSPWIGRGRAGSRYLNSVALSLAREIEQLEACHRDRQQRRAVARDSTRTQAMAPERPRRGRREGVSMMHEAGEAIDGEQGVDAGFDFREWLQGRPRVQKACQMCRTITAQGKGGGSQEEELACDVCAAQRELFLWQFPARSEAGNLERGVGNCSKRAMLVHLFDGAGWSLARQLLFLAQSLWYAHGNGRTLVTRETVPTIPRLPPPLATCSHSTCAITNAKLVFAHLHARMNASRMPGTTPVRTVRAAGSVILRPCQVVRSMINGQW